MFFYILVFKEDDSSFACVFPSLFSKAPMRLHYCEVWGGLDLDVNILCREANFVTRVHDQSFTRKQPYHCTRSQEVYMMVRKENYAQIPYLLRKERTIAC